MKRLLKIGGITLVLIMMLGLSALTWLMLGTPAAHRLTLASDLVDIDSTVCS